MGHSHSTLRIAAGLELASLAVLVLNLATAHWPAVSSVVGPTRGCAYLPVIAFSAMRSRATRTRLAAAVPGVGGLLALRELAGHRPEHHEGGL